MALAKYGKTQKFKRSDSVELHVREVLLTPGERKYVEIREFIRPTGMHGHGVVIPLSMVSNIAAALSGVDTFEEEKG